MGSLRRSLVVLGSLILTINIYAQILPNGTYSVVSKYSGDCVELESLDESAKIIQSICTDRETQKFEFTHIENNYYTISNLAVGQNSNTNGAHIYNSNESDQFKVKVKKKNSKFFRIIEKDSSKYLTAKPHSNEIVQYHGHGGSDQLWKIVGDSVEQEEDSEINFNGVIYKKVTSPETGRVWLDRNIGSNNICTAFNDRNCYGEYYQWGRLQDGHEKTTSRTTKSLANNIDNAGVNFIRASRDWTTADTDWSLRQTRWSKTDGSSICPVEFRVPNIEEWRAETSIQNNVTAFESFLKLPTAGVRSAGAGVLQNLDTHGFYWSTTFGRPSIKHFHFNSNAIVNASELYPVSGESIRCIKD